MSNCSFGWFACESAITVPSADVNPTLLGVVADRDGSGPLVVLAAELAGDAPIPASADPCGLLSKVIGASGLLAAAAPPPPPPDALLATGAELPNTRGT